MEAAKEPQSVVRHPAVRIGAGLSRLQPPGWTSFGASLDSIERMGGLETGGLQIADRGSATAAGFDNVLIDGPSLLVRVA